MKVRAPKLSKEFKPTKVYDILNDSLQTLTDEDLRPMVDAMERWMRSRIVWRCSTAPSMM